ncbi:Fc.00g101960.m01.CDS01 [Cosmosporella sp. VM-42]
MQTFTVKEPYLNLNCGLAESPFWEREENVLRFVDIVKKKVYRVKLNQEPAILEVQNYERPICVTADLVSSDDHFIFGGKDGVGIGHKTSGETEIIQRFWNSEEMQDEKAHRMRANDGIVDSKGRFWVNTLCDPEVTAPAPEGVLFRFDPDGELHRMISGVTIPNGMSWSKDDTKFYFTDTSDSSIYEYDYDAETGDISKQRVFYHFEEEGIGPDGHTQDADGNLWVAVWGSWKAVRISPEGQITAEINLPTRCVTAVAFVGTDLYITSEEEKEPEKYPYSVKYQGGVFKCHVGVEGRRSNKACFRWMD